MPGDTGLSVSRAVDATATRFATMDEGAAPGGLLAGPIDDGGSGAPRTAQLVRLPGSDGTVAVVGWTDPQHVVALREIGPGATGMDVVRIEVPSGADEVLIRSTALEGRNAQLATDLLAQPTTAGIEPARPLDPRLVTFLGVLAVAMAGMG